MIYFITPGDQIWIIHNLMDRIDSDLRPHIQPLSYHDFYNDRELKNGVVIFTGLNVLTDVQRKIAVEISEQLTDRDLDLHLMNHPNKVLGRFDLLKMLHKKGLNSFKAYRLSETSSDEINFPVFIREEHNHTGSISEIINDPESFKKAVNELEDHGFKKESLLVVEYLNTSDETGLFRKYSVQKFGDKIIPRYLSLDFHWVVKENSELPKDRELYTDERVQEEVRFMKENPHEEELRKIFDIAGIEFGRIDYSLLNGKIQTWEINTLPTFGGYPGRKKNNEKRKKREESKQIFYELLSQAVRSSINKPQSGTISITLSHPLKKSISKEQRKQAWVDTILSFGKKMPKIPFLNNLRALLRRKVRQKKER